MSIAGPRHDSVVFALAYNTWADGAGRGMSWSADRMAAQLCADPQVSSLLVADPLRSHAARLRRRARAWDAGFPDDPTRTLVRPRRWRRSDSEALSTTTRDYVRLARRLEQHSRDRSMTRPVLVSCHPVLAAVADRDAWADVVYYGWDDWLSYPPFRPARDLISWSYQQMAARDVHVIGVTEAIVERIGAERGTVVPNGVSASDFDEMGELPDWFRRLDGPIAFYAGSLEERIDVPALEACARELPDWTFVLVGYLAAPDLFADLARLPNVVLRTLEPRPVILAMMAAADVCLVPHRRTPMTMAMSPLKLFEYLGAGSPVVATDLPPMRGLSDRCLLVEPGEPLAPAVVAAAALPSDTSAELAAFRQRHDWSGRYRDWRAAALGA
ncbi:glycosyltransferase [Nocardioides sp. YIM 152315]|uniref:glycosyltransferase n=1 Tax=Nocardioides sp. YIM 152315 TaxID=3031760 RepID=UPI0023DA1844|nr:glycosyltransferase [Nocardioides sp. YIM 152315]MDF1603449.1 glycosyltransferase [Nocardioides sp. YIM 152315]